MSALETVTGALAADFGVTPVVASELEFILHGADGHISEAEFSTVLSERLAQQGIRLHSFDKESGKEQYEIALIPEAPASCAAHTQQCKSIISELAKTSGMQADFSAKPFSDQPGNGLHIHVDLRDEEGDTLFFKQDEIISNSLKHSIAGLLEWMLPSMPVFAPDPESYTRFIAKNNAPITVSWGANNRTVALRLPDAAAGLRHIEHRVAGADANAEHVIAVILAAIYDGLTHKYTIPEQIYGDAALGMYSLPKFPNSLEEALILQENSAFCNRIAECCD